ncbi:hypothetical protein [Kribbella sindirgiensis]|uniref:Glycosyltransferase family 2 protein n=1 Tax=Kribbella sindirgiensis TaxID=1124744 RepID=A0A4R0IC26_9ACTN|nr:hypothetical protein [Kribbella sindirgiensis]TCC29937.1 hypothetical protein E0H50_26250 [Kribbella sindirgiensis]
MSRQIRHGQSHAGLLRDGSAPVAASANTRLDAIVVPAARPAFALQEVISLSAALSVPLVILCSRQAQVEQVARRVEKTLGAQALVVEVPTNYRPPCDAPLTSGEDFQAASANRSSDLSAKRNIGLLLGRMCGWNKILFVDDDIRGFSPRDVRRLAGYLDRHPVASMVSRYFPDNSVVCHARRLAGFRQDVFVSGATLGVNLQHPDLSFFADVYNEDWFFFARHAAERSLMKIGEVSQLEYRPFADPQRAAREEFGDLLAEGLYAAFDRRSGLCFEEQLAIATRASYWQHFKGIRLKTIAETIEALPRAQLSEADYSGANKSLKIAQDRADSISPDLCADFIVNWQEDERRWQKMLGHFPQVRRDRDALAELQLPRWISCGYGLPTESETNFATAGAVG